MVLFDLRDVWEVGTETFIRKFYFKVVDGVGSNKGSSNRKRLLFSSYSTSSWPYSVEALTGERHYYTMPLMPFYKRLISGRLLGKVCYKTQPSIRPLFTALYKKEKSILKTKTEIISSRSERTAESWIQSLALILVAIDSWNSGFRQHKYRLRSYELCCHLGETKIKGYFHALNRQPLKRSSLRDCGIQDTVLNTNSRMVCKTRTLSSQS